MTIYNMKIGIITLYGYNNYGNKLQNYAMQTILEKRGYEVETIVCYKNKRKEKLKKIRDYLFSIIGNPIHKRTLLFRKFDKKNIHTKTIISKDGIVPHTLSEEYDYFVVGSDQVWNPLIRINEKDNFFLKFSEQKKRVAIAPSIACDNIPETLIDEYKKALSGFAYLSCREKQGTDLIEKIVNRKCETLIDPTLFIDAKTWRQFKSENGPKYKYILLFFLGNIPYDVESKIVEIAYDKGLKIINMLSTKEKKYVSDPRDFVNYIDNASLVITDSFHATAFSINLNTPFYVFDRKQNLKEANRMSSRISSLTSLFALESRYCKDKFYNIDFDCDFSICNQQLQLERDKFDLYVKKCLED